MIRVGVVGLAIVAGTVWVACSADGGGQEGADGPAGNTATNGSGGDASSGTETGSGGIGFQAGSGGSTTSGGDGGNCASVSQEAVLEVAPADIIIAVDTSGSMSAEAGWTQNALPSFVSTIAASGIDAHVILIADSDMCVPQPLGSGACNCADELLPAYQHVCQGVGSTNAFQRILDTYPQWSGSLRAGASKTVAVVSDDDSDMGASTFQSSLIALDPTFQTFKFDAIVSSSDPFVPGPCWLLSAAEGDKYVDLVNMTGGVYGDLCLQNFDPVFQDMATSVINSTTIACEMDIPPPPMGETFAPDKVNVEYTPQGGATQQVYNVPGGQAGCDRNGGWYYDDANNPTQIILCPATCDVVQASSAGATIDVLFGCDTEIGPPQ